MFSVRSIRRITMEVLPGAVFVGAVGVVLNDATVASAVLLPLAAWVAVGTQLALRARAEANISAVEAGLAGGWCALTSVARGYVRLGLWRGRGMYDLTAFLALGCGVWWWVCVGTDDHAGRGEMRWYAAGALVLMIAGAWLRMRAPRLRGALLQDVYAVLDSWQHRRSRQDEAAYENAIADHLVRDSFVVEQGARLDAHTGHRSLPDRRIVTTAIGHGDRSGATGWV